MQDQEKSRQPLTLSIEWAKQLITLSVGFLALSATFIERILKQASVFKILIIIFWASLVISIIFSLLFTVGIVNLSFKATITGFGKKNIWYARLSKLFFIAGIIIFVAFVSINFIFSPYEGEKQGQSVQITFIP